MTRSIQTAAELDALPFPNVVTSPGHGDWHKRRDGRWMRDDGDVLTSGALAIVANGGLTLTGDPSAPVQAVSDAAVGAAANAVLRSREFIARFAFGVPFEVADTVASVFARAALTAALPHLAAVPPATRKDVVTVLMDHAHDEGINTCECGDWGEWDEEDWDARAAAWSTHVHDSLLAHFTITARIDTACEGEPT